jgi:hypothetical protein
MVFSEESSSAALQAGAGAIVESLEAVDDRPIRWYQHTGVGQSLVR